jgi:ABC-type uncharacterized transport system permease subunit
MLFRFLCWPAWHAHGLFSFDLQLIRYRLDFYSWLRSCSYLVLPSRLLLGLLAFVSIEIHSIDWAFHATSRFFSGQFLPVGFFPGLLGMLANVLPFRSIFFIPLSIYNGALQGSAIIQSIGFQLLWLTVLWILSRWLWVRVQTRIVSQGG